MLKFPKWIIFNKLINSNIEINKCVIQDFTVFNFEMQIYLICPLIKDQQTL